MSIIATILTIKETLFSNGFPWEDFFFTTALTMAILLVFYEVAINNYGAERLDIHKAQKCTTMLSYMVLTNDTFSCIFGLACFKSDVVTHTFLFLHNCYSSCPIAFFSSIKTPRVSLNVVVISLVFAEMYCLRETALPLLTFKSTPAPPASPFEGNVTRMFKDAVDYCKVTFDALLDVHCSSYETPNLLDDAMQSASQIKSENENNEEAMELNGEECSIGIEQCLSQLDTSYYYMNPSLLVFFWGVRNSHPVLWSSFAVRSQLNCINSSYQSPCMTTNPSWIDLDWPEYCAWIMLMIIMTVVNR
ncbi:uncharacterized protein EV154DRAFT_478118 [Mucor mucedo]|uniref:uncharacterized protein n=1 Tax=Mucor mucedo TaxID=29922 RepID=UPI00221FB9BF|nr:uncharacterized protein EV154DRAFT_478111 [Mucor mucedo]XP_051461140.1 uncharacterized protein EV154DRAFT_478118 [Mucor mucedo]KAI7894720.1 hypothetical protein EV154DRAFT_478111 [Mucor mucedo]KAI7894725.1 hypothetical protein EV154DRAFT_478118 [Mucor mucedo]